MISNLQEGELEHLLKTVFKSQDDTIPQKLDFEPEEAANGLAKLALTIVNLLNEVMEKQAMRKMENNTLTDEQIEKLGITFILLDQRMEELKRIFNLDEDDLKIKLGHVSL